MLLANPGGFLVRFSGNSPQNLTIVYTRGLDSGARREERHCLIFNVIEVIVSFVPSLRVCVCSRDPVLCKFRCLELSETLLGTCPPGLRRDTR